MPPNTAARTKAPRQIEHQPLAEDPGALADEHGSLVREIVAVALMVLALLLLLALVATSQQAAWAGSIGSWVGTQLFFVLGRYVAFALPVMIGLSAVQVFRGRTSVRPFNLRAALRLVGGLLLIVSTCALLTLSVPPEPNEDELAELRMHGAPITGADPDETAPALPLSPDEARATWERQAARRAFELGGLVGNVLISPDGANLGRAFGRVGMSVVLAGLAVIGFILFTETLLRDLFRATYLLVRAVWLAARRRREEQPEVEVTVRGARPVGPGRWRRRGVAFVRGTGTALKWATGVPLYIWIWQGLQQLSFERRPAARVGGVGPILRVTAAPEPDRPAARTAQAELMDDSAAPDDTGAPDEPDAEDAADDAPAAREKSGRRSLFRRKGHSANLEPDGDDGPLAGEPPRTASGRPDIGGLEETLSSLKQSQAEPVQDELDLFPAVYQLPSLDLLAEPPDSIYEMSNDERARLSGKIEDTLDQFKVKVEVVDVIQGPVITRFALKVAPGVRVSRILQLESELAMALKAQQIRLLAPIPGQSAVGIEVPNKKANPVLLKELLASDAFAAHKSPLCFALGKDISGEPVVCDLASMPHLLIAGATGSGKSVCLNAIIASLLYRNKPDTVRMAMIDPKRVELSIYQAIPHLIAPVVSEARKASAALAWCVEQMEQRYKLLSEISVRNIDSYNEIVLSNEPSAKKLGRDLKYMPRIVIVIDELADLMAVAKNEVEEYIIRLAQMARAVGMHLVLATQRPSVNVITGLIKANFPSRIAFQVSSKVDSRTILDMNGAEALLGRGDMLWSPGGAKPFRIQGAFVSDAEVERLADYIRSQEQTRYEKEDFEAKPTEAERAKARIQDDEGEAEADEDHDVVLEDADGPGRMASRGRAGVAPLAPADMESLSDEALYDMALRLVLESRKASVSYIQRRMKIGYARAGRIMDMMEEKGIVGPYVGSKPRDIIVDPAEYLESADEA